MTDPLAEIPSAIDAERRAILAQKERARQHRQEYIFIILMILIMNLIIWIP